MSDQPLHELFVVTRTSVYRVLAKDPQHHDGASAQKIARKGFSKVPIGGYLANGTHVAICECLRMYTPEGGGPTSYERRIEMVNTRWWGGHTSEIVALFTDEVSARRCLRSSQLDPWDPRWLSQTKATLGAIGPDHPDIYICYAPILGLPRELEI